ncbi:hypothetical protein NBC55_23600, partial [Salmonella sp. NW1052]
YSAGRAATTGRTGAVFNLQPPGCRGSASSLTNSLHSVVRLRRAVSPFSKPEEFRSYDPLIDPFWIFH